MTLISFEVDGTPVVPGLFLCVQFCCNWRIQSLWELFALTRVPGPREEPMKLLFQSHTNSSLLPLWQLTDVAQSLESCFCHATLQIPQSAVAVKTSSWVYGNRNKKCSQGILSRVKHLFEKPCVLFLSSQVRLFSGVTCRETPSTKRGRTSL